MRVVEGSGKGFGTSTAEGGVKIVVGLDRLATSEARRSAGQREGRGRDDYR